MIVHVDATRHATLREAQDFKKFRVDIEGGVGTRAAVETACSALLQFEDDATAFVDAAALRVLAPAGEAWEADFAHMLDKARPHGWVRESPALAVKAHVVWLE